MNTPTRLVSFLAATLPVAAQAHHSYAMFDGAAPRETTAVVARFEWTNPHVFLWLHAPDPAAPAPKTMLLGLEGDSVNALRRLGWSREALAPGSKVTVRFFPLRDGRPGGHVIDVRLPDGRVIAGLPGPRLAIEETTRALNLPPPTPAGPSGGQRDAR